MVELITEENNAIEIKYVCNECKKKFLLSEMNEGKTTDDKLICESCYGENYFTCARCGHVKHKNDMSENLDDICQRCYDNHYSECGECGRSLPYDDLLHNERNDNYYCSDCYEDNTRENFKPECKHILKYSDMSEDKSFNIFGVEIEAIFPDLHEYDITCKDELKHFSIVEDSSLSEDGREFVTCPLPNNEIGKDVLKTFCDTIGKRYLKIDSSCGLHIHFFFHRNLVTKDNIKKIIIAYRNLEELFFDINPKSRRNNNYCKSLNNKLFSEMLKQSSIEEMLELFYEMKIRSIESVPEDKYYKHRYYWVNFNSIFYRNTIEIRLHSGSINYEKIINWYNIHRILLEYCISSDYESVENLTSEKFLYLLPDDLRHYVRTRIIKFKNHVEQFNQEE